MWNRSRPTRASSWSGWKSRMSTRSTASRRPSPSGRRTPRAIRARRSRPPPSATISCACCSRASARPFARTAARACARTRWTKWRRGCWRSPRDRAGTRCFPAASTADRRRLRDHLFELRKKGFNRLFQDGRAVRIFHSGIAARYRFRASLCSSWWTASRSARICTSGMVDTVEICYREAGEVIFESAARRRAAALQREVPVQDVRHGIRRRRSRSCSASTARRAPARAARASATPSISTWTA